MELTHAERIFSDIGSMVKEIKAYFRDLDSENIGSEMYADRIAKELGARIENLNGVIQTTLADISGQRRPPSDLQLEPVDQNRYYDSKNRDQVSSRIDETASFSPEILPKKYIQIASGVVAAWRHLSRCCSYRFLLWRVYCRCRSGHVLSASPRRR